MTGMIVYAVHAKKLYISTKNVNSLAAGKMAGYQRMLNIFLSSHLLTCMLVFVAIIIGLLISLIHIRFSLKGLSWGPLKSWTASITSIVSTVALASFLCWFIAAMNYIATWSMALWILESSSYHFTKLMQDESVPAEMDCELGAHAKSLHNLLSK